MKKVRQLALAGCWELDLFQYLDDRGVFVKPWDKSFLDESGLSFEMRECFWSISPRGSIRGMHFQQPPHAHRKVVQCQHGKTLDVLLDLRSTSGTFGQSMSLELSYELANAIYIPEGIAHGFQCLSESSQVLYFTSLEHVPQSDCGIHWNSFGFDWPLPCTQISKRDQQHPSLSDYSTPF